MRTVVVGDPPREVEDFLERRRALGQDLFDEVWEGEYHVAPAPHRRHGELDFQLARILGPLADRRSLRGSGPCNIGEQNDYRVPDQAFFADSVSSTYNPTAELVVEIVSPGDESREKFDFYHAAGVKEVLIVDPEDRLSEWFVRGEAGYTPTDRSSLLDVSVGQLHDLIDWPR